ncbi:MAG: hypothetical protein IT280_04495 [Ignavibacteria bacterium]|nr:hypothetical protein [Ignavibacteria bacterium]
MKKLLLLAIVIALNFTAPNNMQFNNLLKHKIEFRQEDNSPNLTDKELKKNKAVSYLRMHMLLREVKRIDKILGFNTS